MTKTKSSAATIRDVARQAGVSVATVSRYINHNAPVSAEVAARLETVMVELHYTPQANARSLATHRTHTLGLLMVDIAGDFFPPLLSGIEAVTYENGYDLLISSIREPERRRTFPLPVGPHNTDGLLVFADSLDAEGMQRFAASHFPLVLIHRSSPEGLIIPCVTVENKAASCTIVEHLIETHNRRRILFLQGPGEQEDSQWRELGYREALEKHNIPFDPALVAPGNFDRVIAYHSMQQLLARGVIFDAVFTGDDEAAVGALMALNEAGITVPDAVSVAGFDDQRMAPFLTPPLTTVRAPTEEVGRVAAQQLLSLIRTGQANPLTLLPTEIVIRCSCGCNS